MSAGGFVKQNETLLRCVRNVSLRTHLLGDGGKILLCAAVSGLGAKVDSGPTEQVEEAAVGYPRALETEAAGVLGIALSGA